MANLAATLKEEIRRLARKEIRAQVGGTKQSVATYRREIAALKREVADLNRQLNRMGSHRPTVAAAFDTSGEDTESLRFSPKSVKSQRTRLGFSAKDYGRLVGVSMLTIYNWEQGKSRPRRSQLAALAAVRGIGKREALARLAQQNGTE